MNKKDLGYADVIELREQLVHINVVFATEVISSQTVINRGLNELLDKIYSILNPSSSLPLSSYVTVALKPPIILLLQMLEGTLSSLNNINGFFTGANIQIDPYYLLKQYLPGVNWDDFKKHADDYMALLNAKNKDKVEEER